MAGCFAVDTAPPRALLSCDMLMFISLSIFFVFSYPLVFDSL